MQRRKELGYTQEELAEKIGFSKNHLSSVERGKYVPTTQFVFQICNALGESPDYYLIGRITEESSELNNLIKSLPQHEQKILCKLLHAYIDELS